jgi:hypothetical protein
MMKYAPCRLLLRNAVVAAKSGLSTNQDRASVCGNSRGSHS